MIINSLTLKNFKSFDFLKIHFADYGTYIIKGSNASGKTNFLKALAFAFCIELPYDQNNLIKNNENNAFVNIELKGSNNSKIKKYLTYSRSGNLISFIRPKNTDISQMFKTTDFFVILDAYEKSKEEILQELSEDYKVYLLDNILTLFSKKECETLLYPKFREMKAQKKTVFLTSTQRIDGFKNIELDKNE